MSEWTYCYIAILWLRVYTLLLSIKIIKRVVWCLILVQTRALSFQNEFYYNIELLQTIRAISLARPHHQCVNSTGDQCPITSSHIYIYRQRSRLTPDENPYIYVCMYIYIPIPLLSCISGRAIESSWHVYMDVEWQQCVCLLRRQPVLFCDLFQAFCCANISHKKCVCCAIWISIYSNCVEIVIVPDTALICIIWIG